MSKVKGDDTNEDEKRNMHANALDGDEEQDDMVHETPEDVFHDLQWHVKHAKDSDREAKLVHPTVPDDLTSPLSHVAYNHQGDHIMDFSMVGWNEGNTDIPNTKDIPVIERLWPRQEADSELNKGDDTDRIQSALDRVSQATENLVQRNQVIPTGSLALYRKRSVQDLAATRDSTGKEDQMLEDTDILVVSGYTPVGFSLALDATYFEDVGLAVGDQVVVTRVGNDHWVKDIGMDDFDNDKKGVKPWKKMRGRMHRTIRALNQRTGIVRLDAPLPIWIRRQYGGYVTKYKDRKIRALGIQFLDMVFPRNIGTTQEMLDEKGRGSKDYRFSDEIFANYALRMNRACHMYITHAISAFFHNFVSLGTNVHHVTLDSIVHSYPDEMLSGQSAFQLSVSFIDSKRSMLGKPYQPMALDFAPGEVGPHMKFCTGILVDQGVTDESIQTVNRGDMGTGQGYAGANSVVWNSRAREGILTHRAGGFQNFVISSEDLEAEDRQPWDSHGWKGHLGGEVLPESLYLRQLADCLDRLSKGWIA
ncbi:hypothetical protein BGX34_009284 [Mortierella sp. NVP85]|nr:hypothetical protein BGX34_009284 [Mortierella sp. NVP85]